MSDKRKINRINIELAERSYPMYVGQNIQHSLGKVCTSHKIPKRVAIVTDTTVARLYLKQVTNILRHSGFDVSVMTMKPGERQKSLSQANVLYDKLLEEKFSRASALIALGGGVVGDVTGFVAATYRRGVPYIQIPTTLLAQVESAIGGKTGVNLHENKNAVGAFYQPKFVFSDVSLLSSLPKREIICGLGEMLKYAYLDEEIFCLIDNHLDDVMNLDLDVLEKLIVKCNAVKARLVSEDERELKPTGGRMVLNLGHTIGHALEVLSSYKLHHGEAVLIGLRWELQLAKNAGIVAKSDFEKLNNLLQRIHFQPKMNFLKPKALVEKIFGKEKQVRFILPKQIGEVVAERIARALVVACLKRV